MIYFQPSMSGVSGDMMLGALVALGADCGLIKAFEGFPYGSTYVTEVNIRRDGEFASASAVFDEEANHRSPEELAEMMRRAAEYVGASEYAVNGAMGAVSLLVQAEKDAHGTDHVHLHEVGSFDTVFDCLGFYMLLESLGDKQVFSSSILTGTGCINIAHGTVPVPPPAVRSVAARNSVPLVLDGPYGELATPTGVALLASCAVFRCAPEGVLCRTGYGKGTREFEGRVNALPAYLMETAEISRTVQFEATLDDITGEEMARAIAKISKISKEVVCVPAVGKKGRPVYILRVLAAESAGSAVKAAIFSCTPTRGVREWNVSRSTLCYRTKELAATVRGCRVPLRWKISRMKGHVLAKPESDDMDF